jgi:SOS-response transcriptional repressor LexA
MPLMIQAALEEMQESLAVTPTSVPCTVSAMAPGERIRKRREALGLSLEQVAESVGVSYQAVQQWETRDGVGYVPRGDRRKKLAHALQWTEPELEFGIQQAQMPLGDYNVAEGPNIGRVVPLISWVQAGSFHEPIDPYRVGDAEDWLPIPKRAGPRTFALRVRGISMEPKYHDGEIIFVDPDGDARNRSHVIVRLEHEKEATFKELVIEGDRRYLRALNPSWPEPVIPVTREATICGVVVGKWVDV